MINKIQIIITLLNHEIIEDEIIDNSEHTFLIENLEDKREYLYLPNYIIPKNNIACIETHIQNENKKEGEENE